MFHHQCLWNATLTQRTLSFLFHSFVMNHITCMNLHATTTNYNKQTILLYLNIKSIHQDNNSYWRRRLNFSSRNRLLLAFCTACLKSRTGHCLVQRRRDPWHLPSDSFPPMDRRRSCPCKW